MSEHTVAHVVQNLDVGGLERIVVSLVTQVDNSRYRPVLFCLGTGGRLVPELLDRGYTVHAMDKKPGLDYFLLWRLVREFRAERVSIVHCHNFSPLVYGALAAQLRGCRAVAYTAHGAKTSGRKKPAWFQRAGLVREMVYVSEDARRVAISQGWVSENGTRTIHNGVDIDGYQRDTDAGRDIRREYGIEDTAPVVGIVARLSAAKDHENLFRAMVKLRESHADIRCLVVGDGERKSEIEAAVTRLDLGDCVCLAGARSDVARVLSAMDVFVLSSYTEGLAVTLVEAMAVGLPVVATNVGGNPEVVVDGDTGYIVPARDSVALADGIDHILTNPARALEMGRTGEQRAREKFSAKSMCAQYEALYEELTLT